MRQRRFFVYIMMNSGGTTLYTGVTNDLVRRVAEHRDDLSDSFTARYNAHRLVYYEVHESIRAAIAREKQIKRWSRKKKEYLIRTRNPRLLDLSEEVVRFHAVP